MVTASIRFSHYRCEFNVFDLKLVEFVYIEPLGRQGWH